MTVEQRNLLLALPVSLVLHLAVTAFFFTFSGGEGGDPVKIYTVRILEAPGRPQAQELSLSTQPISELRLDSPSLSISAPPLQQPDAPEIPPAELMPQTEAPPSAVPTPEATPSHPSQPPQLPGIAPPPDTATAVPKLPPAQPAIPPPPPGAVTPPGIPASPPLPPSLPPTGEPQDKTLLERTGERVRSLQLNVESAPPSLPAESPGARPGERNLLSLRIYSNAVREAVKKQYTFPGGFSGTLRTRVRVALNRDGTVREMIILESSGDERFDRLVCLAAIRSAKKPSVPEDIPDDPLFLYFTCSP